MSASRQTLEAVIKELRRENHTLRIQLLTITKKLAEVIAILTEHLKEWGQDGQK